MSNKVFFGVIAVLIVAVLGVAVYLNNKEDNQPEKKTDVAAVSDNDYIKGAEDAKVTLIEYGDFQCPYCGAVHPILQQVLPEYEEDVRFVFRHFPITSIHPNALVAHKAAEAAGRQGKFWEMHDKLYANQQAWSQDDKPIEVVTGYAKELKLDMRKFDSDFNNPDLTDRINAVKNAGESAGVESTPTMFLNGKKIDAPRSADELKQKLDQAIKAVKNSDKSE